MRRVPEFKSDEEAETFLDLDLSDLDFSQFKQVDFAIEGKATQVNLRVPASLLAAVKLRAKARGITHGRYIRELIERDVARTSPRPAQVEGDKAVERPNEGRGPAR